MGNASVFSLPPYSPKTTRKHCYKPPGQGSLALVMQRLSLLDTPSQGVCEVLGWVHKPCPHSSLLTQTQSKEKASAKLPPAPAVAAGRQWELSTADSHICPWLVVKGLAQDTASTGGTQNLHPGGSLLLFFKVPVLVHVSRCQFRADITSEP